MRSYLRPLAIALVSLGMACTADAGPNEDGVIILHAVPYQSRDFPPLCEGFDLVNCEEATVNVPGGEFWKWWVVGAFPAGSGPRLSGVSFGIEYDASTVLLLDYGSCADFELPTSDWPATGSGTAVTWLSPQTDPLIEIYAFAGYEYYGLDAQFCLVPHPTQGGNFADDSVPSIIDPIADYGCLGFNLNPGYLPCPEQPIVGACCLPDGSCVILTEADCNAEAGVWIGPGSGCDPDPCAVPTQERSWGAVKNEFR